MQRIRALASFALLLGIPLLPRAVLAQGPIDVVKDYGVGNLLGGLVQRNDGSFFGVIGDDGNNFPPPPSSSIFHLLPNGTSQTVFSFPVDGSLGLNPNALLEASDGNLYGTTSSGGASGMGVIYRLTLAGGFQILHQFTGPDGDSPAGRLTQAFDGRLYGAASAGGTHGDGTLFRIDLAGHFAVLFSFSGTDGSSPNGNLVEIGSSLYGTTQTGGSAGVGTIYRLGPLSGVTTLHQFNGVEGCPNPLTSRNDGKLYGSTADLVFTRAGLCSAGLGYGTIFSIDPTTAAYSRLYQFASNQDGIAFPLGPLLAASDGKLYGTTEVGGSSAFSVGTFFSYVPGGILSTADFQGGAQGGSPCCELLQSLAGPVYGVTAGFISIEGDSPDSVVNQAATSLAAPVPTIQNFAPQSGRVGTTVLLRGDHFLGASAVSLNGVRSLFAVTSTGSIYVTVPSGAVTGPISVTNLGGVTSTAGVFTIK